MGSQFVDDQMCHWNWKRMSVETYEQIHWLSRYWRAFRDPICSYSRSSQRLHLQLHGVFKQTPSPLEPSESYSWPDLFWCLPFLSIISFLDFFLLADIHKGGTVALYRKSNFFHCCKVTLQKWEVHSWWNCLGGQKFAIFL